MRIVCRTQSGTLARGPLGDRRTVLQHQFRHEALEVGQDEQVGAVAGRDRAETLQPVPQRGIERRADQRVLRRDPVRDRVPHHPVDVAVVGDVLRLSVVGAERDPPGAVFGEQRQERLEVPRRGGLADQQPHPGAEPLASLLGRVRLVVRADPGGRVGVQRPAEDAGSVTVDVLGQCELRELGRRAADHAWEVHHLREPDHAAAAEQRIEIARGQLAPRRLEARCRHARRRHEVDVERDVVAHVDQPVHTVGAEDVRDLVRVGDDRRRAERQDQPRELVDEQLRRLEMHVRVDESRHHPATGGVQHLQSLVRAEPRDVAVDDGDVRRQPLPSEHREHAAAADDEVCRFVAAGHRQAA